MNTLNQEFSNVQSLMANSPWVSWEGHAAVSNPAFQNSKILTENLDGAPFQQPPTALGNEGLMQLMRSVLQIVAAVMQILRQSLPQLMSQGSAGLESGPPGSISNASASPSSNVDPSTDPSRSIGSATPNCSSDPAAIPQSQPVTTSGGTSTIGTGSESAVIPSESPSESPGFLSQIGNFFQGIMDSISGKTTETSPQWLSDLKGLVEKGGEVFSSAKDGFFKGLETVINVASWIFTGGKLFKGILKGLGSFGKLVDKGLEFAESGFGKAKSFLKKIF